jgi:hypothetical protein
MVGIALFNSTKMVLNSSGVQGKMYTKYIIETAAYASIKYISPTWTVVVFATFPVMEGKLPKGILAYCIPVFILTGIDQYIGFIAHSCKKIWILLQESEKW